MKIFYSVRQLTHFKFVNIYYIVDGIIKPKSYSLYNSELISNIISKFRKDYNIDATTEIIELV